MRKFLKRFFQICVSFVILSVILVIGLTVFIDPNQFKDQIEQQVLNQTGHDLKIQGPIYWRWFPMLSIELNQIVIAAPAPFKNPILSSKSAKAEAELLPLLSGKLFLNLMFNNLNISLERDARGQENWENSKKPLKQPSTTSNPSEAVSSSSKGNHLVLNSISVKGGQVTFKDEAKNNFYKFNNVNLAAENLFGKTIGKTRPISLNFNLEDSKSKSLGKVVLSSQCFLQNSNQINVENLSLKLTLPDGTASELRGEATVYALNTSPYIQGHFETKNLKLDPWLKDPKGSANSTLPSVVNVNGSFKYQANKLQISSFDIRSTAGNLKGAIDINLGDYTLKTVSLKADFSSPQLKLNQFTIQELKGKLIGEASVFTLAPFDFQVAKIPQHTTLKMDLRGTQAQYALTAEGRGFEINQLLELFNVKNKIEGKTQYNLKLATTGNSMEESRKNLSGHLNFEINNGRFYGMDLINLLKSTQSNTHGLVSSLLHKQSFNVKNVVQSELQKWTANPSGVKTSTPFSIVKASSHINSGTLKNSDLIIEHAEYKMSGEGTCDLNTLAIQYQLSAILKNNPYPANDEIGNYLYTVPLPIKLVGTLGDLHVRPDINAYTSNAIAYAQKHLLEKVVEKNINKVIDKGINKAFEKLLKH